MIGSNAADSFLATFAANMGELSHSRKKLILRCIRGVLISLTDDNDNDNDGGHNDDHDTDVDDGHDDNDGTDVDTAIKFRNFHNCFG